MQAGIPLSKLNVELDRPRPRPREPGRHRVPVGRRRHVDRHPRHRPAVRQPVEPHRRPAHRHRRRLGARGHARAQRRRARRGAGRGRRRSACCRWSRSSACRRSTCTPLEQAERVDAVLERWDDEITGHDHFEFFWIPNTGWALTKRNRRTDEPVAPRTRMAAFRDDYLLTNVGFDLTCRAGRLRSASSAGGWPSSSPAPGRVEYTDASYKVFASARLVKFYEMEYAIPNEHLVEALNRVRDLVRRHGVQICFPVEVRVVAADDIPLSTAYGRDDRLHRGARVPGHRRTTSTSRACEGIMDDYGGRPHWGKMHFQIGGDAGAPLPAVGRVPGGCGPSSTPTAGSPAPTSIACSAPSRLTRRTAQAHALAGSSIARRNGPSGLRLEFVQRTTPARRRARRQPRCRLQQDRRALPRQIAAPRHAPRRPLAATRWPGPSPSPRTLGRA